MSDVDSVSVDSGFLELLRVVKKAGDEILDVYSSDFDVEFKGDDSPLTLADKRANDVICSFLKEKFSDIPILSEEGRSISFDERKKWKKFWLIDPLDGKEFVKKNDEFTVNVSLIENRKSVLGIVYVPVTGVFYFAKLGFGSFKLEDVDVFEIESEADLMKSCVRLPLDVKRDKFVVVGSKSHMSDDTLRFIDSLKEEYESVEVLSFGSSLKFCMVATGVADCYPRFAPTMEWDIGASQIIIEEAGGKVIDWDSKKDFRYNKENLVNSWFLVFR
jgi:3'(2'), 5'-bisphosphate nucleotidase